MAQLDPNALEGTTPLEQDSLPPGMQQEQVSFLGTAQEQHPTHAGITFEFTPFHLRALLAPPNYYKDVAPSNANKGTEGQEYYHIKFDNSVDWYQYQELNGGWVKVFSQGPTAKEQTPNKLPVVTLTTPKTGATVGEKLTFTVGAYDPDADGKIITVELFQSNRSLGTRNELPYIFEFTPTTTGTLQFTAKATDNRGQAAVSDEKQVSVVAANVVPPQVTLVYTGGSTSVGQALPISARVIPGTEAVTVVTFYDGSTVIEELFSPPYAIDFISSEVRTHALTAIVTDAKGNGVQSEIANIEVTAAVNPNSAEVFLSSPTVVAGQPITIQAVVAAPRFGVDDVAFYVDGSVFATRTDTANGKQYQVSVTYTPTTAGPKTIYVRMVDQDGGGATSPSKTLTVTAATQPTTPPAPTFTGFSDTDAGGTVTMVPAEGIPLGDYRVSLPGSTSFAAVSSPTITVGNVAGTVRAYSVAGTNRLQSPTAASAAFTAYAAPANAAPVVTSFTPTTSTSIQAGDTVTFTASASDSDGTVGSIQVLKDGNLAGTISGASGSFTTSPLSAGSHAFTVRATDNQGAQGAVFGTTITVTATAAPVIYSHFLDAGNNEGTGLDGMAISTEAPRRIEFNQKSTTADPQVLTISDGGVTSYVNWSGDYKGDGAAWYDGAGVRHDFIFPNPAADFTLSY